MQRGRLKSNTIQAGIGLAVCAAALTASGEMQLLPVGPFRARDGRPRDVKAWQLDAAIAARVIAKALARTNPIPTDYEHQTLLTRDNGQPAPAAGWFRTIEWREGQGLFATDVEWTARAKQMIEDKEYLYFSPVFQYDTRTGEVLEILHGGITNTPALDGMNDLASRAAATFGTDDQPDEEIAPMKKLLELFGLSETATEAEGVAAASAVIAKQKEGETALVAAKAQAPDPAKFVPVETVTKLQNDLAALTAAHNQNEVDALVRAALSDGRVLPAMEPWARDLGKKDVAQLKAFIDAAQPIAALKGTQSGGKGPETKEGDLDAAQLAVCKAMGLTADEYKKSATA